MALSKVLRKHRSLTNFIVRHSSKIVSSPFRDVPLSKLPYHDYLFENVSFHRQRTALVNGVTGILAIDGFCKFSLNKMRVRNSIVLYIITLQSLWSGGLGFPMFIATKTSVFLTNTLSRFSLPDLDPIYKVRLKAIQGPETRELLEYRRQSLCFFNKGWQINDLFFLSS